MSGARVGSAGKKARALHQVSTLARGDDGKVALPVGPIHGVTLENLGTVQSPDVPGFHSATYVLPVGYRTTRQYVRCDDPDAPRTRWVQEICRGEGDDEGKPLFRLSADEGLNEPIVAKSATAAWAEVLRRVAAVRRANGEEPKKTAISGPEFFGYSLPHIRLLIEELPGVNECVEYKPLLERRVTVEPYVDLTGSEEGVETKGLETSKKRPRDDTSVQSVPIGSPMWIVKSCAGRPWFLHQVHRGCVVHGVFSTLKAANAEARRVRNEIFGAVKVGQKEEDDDDEGKEEEGSENYGQEDYFSAEEEEEEGADDEVKLKKVEEPFVFEGDDNLCQLVFEGDETRYKVDLKIEVEKFDLR